MRCRPGETPADALARAIAAGFLGVLVAPAPQELDAWLLWAQIDTRQREARNGEVAADVLARHRPEHAQPPGSVLMRR